jgi:hypothetical protein
MKTCIACSMPLMKKEDFAKGDESSDFCQYCVNEDGSVKTCEEIFNGGVEFFMQSIQADRGFAEKVVRKNMSQLPYWQGKNCEILNGEKATDAEFQEVLRKL